MSLQVWPCALTNELLLEICPYRQNRYSCILSRADSGILSGYLLEAAALVERGADGHPRGMLWKSAFPSGRLVSSGWCVRVASEQTTVQVELISLSRRHYSVSVNPNWALEIACQLWVHSTAAVLAEK